MQELNRLGQISRGVNVMSVDNANRRETPLITAARMGQSDAVELMLRLACDIIDIEAKDGQGRK